MTPSVTVNVIVNIPVWASLGVQVSVPVGDVPCAAANVAPIGSCVALRVSDGAGRELSVAVIWNVRIVSSLTDSVAGTFSVILPCTARRVKMAVAEWTSWLLVAVIVRL